VFSDGSGGPKVGWGKNKILNNIYYQTYENNIKETKHEKKKNR